jgi:hypothetical protein
MSRAEETIKFFDPPSVEKLLPPFYEVVHRHFFYVFVCYVDSMRRKSTCISLRNENIVLKKLRKQTNPFLSCLTFLMTIIHSMNGN